jgi:hypothetical protein
MKVSTKKLKVCGFSRCLTGTLGKSGRLTRRWTDEIAADAEDIVYVFIRNDRCCIKVGESGGKLRHRLQSTFRTVEKMERRASHSRQSEINFQTRFRQYLSGKSFSVWYKRARQKKVEFFSGFRSKVSLRHAEEIYFTKLFQPKINLNLKSKAR